MTRTVRNARRRTVRRSTYRRLRFRNVWARRLHRHADTIELTSQVVSALMIAVVFGALGAVFAWSMLGAL